MSGKNLSRAWDSCLSYNNEVFGCLLCFKAVFQWTNLRAKFRGLKFLILFLTTTIWILKRLASSTFACNRDRPDQVVCFSKSNFYLLYFYISSLFTRALIIMHVKWIFLLFNGIVWCWMFARCSLSFRFLLIILTRWIIKWKWRENYEVTLLIFHCNYALPFLMFFFFFGGGGRRQSEATLQGVASFKNLQYLLVMY